MSTKFALCIGINDYPGTGSDLSGCINDANDWGAVLAARGFAVQKLINKKATRQGILDAMKAIIDSAVDGDSIIFQNSALSILLLFINSFTSDLGIFSELFFLRRPSTSFLWCILYNCSNPPICLPSIHICGT